MGGLSGRRAAERPLSQNRLREHAVGDPRDAASYLDALVKGAQGPIPLEPGLSYVANLLQRHVAHRAQNVAEEISHGEPRLVPALRRIADGLRDAALLANRVEETVGALVIDVLPTGDADLLELLTRLRAKLDRLRESELHAAMAAWVDDLGGSE